MCAQPTHLLIALIEANKQMRRAKMQIFQSTTFRRANHVIIIALGQQNIRAVNI